MYFNKNTMSHYLVGSETETFQLALKTQSFTGFVF